MSEAKHLNQLEVKDFKITFLTLVDKPKHSTFQKNLYGESIGHVHCMVESLSGGKKLGELRKTTG